MRGLPGLAPGARSPASRAVEPAPARLSSLRVALLAGLVVAAALLLRNTSLFTDRIWEVGDAAANSVLVEQATRLQLLVGHYSRVGFNHPGPAVLYVQAAGELVFHDVLHLVPGPFNGQVLAVVLLESATVGAVVGVLHSWSRSTAVALAAPAVVLTWYATSDHVLTSTWMPLVVVAPFLLLIVSAASVAGGRTEHLWLLAASGGLLVHGHVEFALFSPALCVAALAGCVVLRRGGPRALWRQERRALLVAAAVLGAFALPIVVNTLLHWPGEVPKYVTYSSDEERVPPTLAEALHYARLFWFDDSATAKYQPALLVGAAVVAAVLAPRPLRRPLLLLTAMACLAEALFVVYALVGIDDLQQLYIGSFSWSVPLALLLVLAVSAVAHLPKVPLAGLAVAAVSAVLVVRAVALPSMALRPEGVAGLGQAVTQVAEQAAAGPVVLDIGPGLAPFADGTGLLVALERRGRDACVAQDGFAVQVTADNICTPAEAATGTVVQLRERAPGAQEQVAGGLSAITVRR